MTTRQRKTEAEPTEPTEVVNEEWTDEKRVNHLVRSGFIPQQWADDILAAEAKRAKA